MDARVDAFDDGRAGRDPARRIDLAHEPDFEIGSLTIQPSLRRIEGPLGETMIEPKMMQVLVALAEEPGAILSRDDLIERCWEGRIVGDASINRIISLLRTALREVGGDAAQIDNVPKVGYRLLVEQALPVEAKLAETAQEKPEITVQPQAAQNRNWRPLAAALAVLAVIVVAGFGWWQSRQAAVEPVTIAMLPLQYSEEVDALYAKGLESELRGQLAGIGDVYVTASESAGMLVADGLEPQEIGKRLSADYVWSGSLASETDRVVLSARLIDVDNGTSQWADTLASAPNDAQFLPLRTAREIASSLGRPLAGSADFTAISSSGYQLYLTALGLLKSRGTDERVAALQIMQQVTSENPDFADGWAVLAKAWYLNPYKTDSVKDGNWGEAERLAEYALTIDPNSIEALKVAGSLSQDRRGLEMLHRATELDPGDAEAWFWLGIAQRKTALLADDPVEAALRMTQIDPLWPPSWRGSDLAAEFGRLDLARQMERDIIAAGSSPVHKRLARARIARIEGDFSEFIRLSRSVGERISEGQRTYGTHMQNRIIRVLLNIRPDETQLGLPVANFEMLTDISYGVLPSAREFEAAGLTGMGFWGNEHVASSAPPLLIAEGRGAELLAHYDAAFPDYEAFAAFAEQTGVPERVIPQLAPHLILAFREAGRDREAEVFLAAMEEQVARWRDAETGWLQVVLVEIDLAALKGQNERAASLVTQLPRFAWPYANSHVSPRVFGLLRTDPLYDDVRNLPQARATLDPIRATLEREREEVLALGVM